MDFVSGASIQKPYTRGECSTSDSVLVQRLTWPRPESFGYPLSFLERRLFLQILYNRLPRKERVHTNKKVVSIHLRGAGALVETQDGQTYPADLVIGADGVHSLVRSEIWRLGDEVSPDFVTEQEKSSTHLIDPHKTDRSR
jgi:2-polyprenyl-6-methoxyphenol hydroxylase-like FAD-dependent oxidoreductase